LGSLTLGTPKNALRPRRNNGVNSGSGAATVYNVQPDRDQVGAVVGSLFVEASNALVCLSPAAQLATVQDIESGVQFIYRLKIKHQTERTALRGTQR